LLVGLSILTGILLAGFFNWRQAVKLTFFLLVIEGVLRKWILPQASELIYFLKDFVLLAAYVRYFLVMPLRQGFSIRLTALNFAIFLAAAWCLFQMFNPGIGSPFVGIFGLRAYLFYIPLIWMLPAVFRTEEELYNFLRWHLLLAIPVGILGVVQFFSPIDSPLNTYAPGIDETQIGYFEGTTLVRVTGSFAYINSYTGYLVPSFGLLLALMPLKADRLWRFLLVVEMLMVSVNAVMTGSRNAVFSLGLVFVGYLGFRLLKRPKATLRLAQRLVIPAIVLTLVAAVLFRPALEAFWFRVTKVGDITERVSNNLFEEPIRFAQYKQLDGYGTGATHQATPVLRRMLNLPPGEYIPVYYEAEMGRIVLELGPIGFMLWYGMRLAIALALLRLAWTLKRPFLQQMALIAFLVQMVWLPHQLVFHNVFSLYYWFLAGFVYLLPQLERVEIHKQALAFWLNSAHVEPPRFPSSSSGQPLLP